MTGLQGLDTARPYLVTLNDNGRVDQASVIERLSYSHPVYNMQAIAAQKEWSRISGVDGIHYCGAYWGYGFHEDGLKSGLDVCRSFGLEL